MNLIRNGGFERGDIAFWESVTPGVLESSDLLPKYGVYCGKFTSSGAVFEYIRNIDYITVEALRLLKWSAWLKSTASRGMGMSVWMYDSDYSHINTYTSGLKTASATWDKLMFEYVNNPDVAYIRVGCYIYLSVADEVFYIDNMMFNPINADTTPVERQQLFNESGVIASGDSTGDSKDMQGFKTYYADLDVEVATGTNETLDVVVKEIDGNGVAIVVGTFAQKVAAGQERIVLSNIVGRGLYIVYTIGGTDPSFNFEIELTGKR